MIALVPIQRPLQRLAQTVTAFDCDDDISLSLPSKKALQIRARRHVPSCGDLRFGTLHVGAYKPLGVRVNSDGIPRSPSPFLRTPPTCKAHHTRAIERFSWAREYRGLAPWYNALE